MMLVLKYMGIVPIVLIGVSLIAVVNATDSYCFKFTWVGPEYDNDTISNVANKTCEDLKSVPPCYEPLVVTFDGSPPDTAAIWENYDRDSVSCKLTRNTVCLKWVSYYDGKVENITYTCGKMTGPSGSIQSGCETNKNGAYMTEACACRTAVVNGDPREPCNSSSYVTVNFWTSLLILTSTLLALRGSRLY